MQAIRFPMSYKKKGFAMIVDTGRVVYTPQKGVFLVPEATLKVLEEQGIPYEKTEDHWEGWGDNNLRSKKAGSK